MHLPVDDCSHPWAHRQGLRFFLLWTGGALLGRLHIPLWNLLGNWNNTAARDVFLTSAFVASVCVAIWHGWLLFRWHRRTALWVVPILVSYPVFQFTALSISWKLFIASILSAGCRYAAIRGVRKHPAAWFLIAALMYAFSSSHHVMRAIVRMLDELLNLSALVASALPGIQPYMVLSTMYESINLVSLVAAGAALAWWMTPLPPPANRTLKE